MEESPRPDPDDLLRKIQQEEAEHPRGHLKVFFGASAGVGKTYAMLQHAHQKSKDGVHVTVGIVETHGREETASLLEGFEQIPLVPVSYRGRSFEELNLDGILERKPQLVLVDELAHTNVPGARHKKRWQDVEEILNAGIDVYTTLNVQHLDSLNDIVGQITGIHVRETVPDRFFEKAEEVALIDLPPDELIRRLDEGKIYIPKQAEKATQSFFRRGNLIALRELALRRTADSVDSKMREYRTGRGIKQLWQTKERILVCVGPHPESERLVRAASRIASALHADWIAVYVETPDLAQLSLESRSRIFTTLKIAEDLGAHTSTVSGTDVPQTLIAFAREHNVTAMVLGKARKKGIWNWGRKDLTNEISQLDPSLLLHVIGEAQTSKPRQSISRRASKFLWKPYGIASLILAFVTIGCTLLYPYLDLANIIMAYLVAVVFIAFRHGRNPGLFTSILGVLCFDIFFVPPRFSLGVQDSRHLMTFAIMLGVAVLVGTLTSKLKFQATVAARREHRADILYQVGRELANSLTVEKAVEVAVHHISGIFSARTRVLLPDAQDKLQIPQNGVEGEGWKIDEGLAQWCFENRKPAGMGTDTVSQSSVRYVPLPGTMKIRGVVAVEFASADFVRLPEQVRLLETIATQVGQTLERIHYIEVAQDSIVRMETERLRNTLLASVSHDIRTPLAALVGQTGNLLTLQDSIPREMRHIVQNIHQDAERLGNIVRNILDMASLQSGQVQIKKAWQPIDEVIGVSVAEILRLYPGLPLDVDIPESIPLVEIDSVLFDRVFSNLLGNAVKYAGLQAPILLSVRALPDEIRIYVEDEGPGIPEIKQNAVFEKFKRGDEEHSLPGVGLGLSICRAIVEAHSGKIWVENRSPKGARFVVSIPNRKPPENIQAAWEAHDTELS